MSNFTHEPLLSLMITFGIQGVLLITAWLIGETFASSRRESEAEISSYGAVRILAMRVLGGLLLLALGGLLAQRLGYWPDASQALLATCAVLLALMLVVVSAGGDVIAQYLGAMRVIARNAPLWIMFLACMGASVFFSFDSLFTTLFPETERLRSAEVRARSEVARLSTDVVNLAARRRSEARTEFFASGGWEDYANGLDRLAANLRAAPGVIDQYVLKQKMARRAAEAEQKGVETSLRRQQQQLQQQKELLASQADMLRREVKQVGAKISALREIAFARDREIAEKRAEVEAEEKGFGKTNVAGRGPRYRFLERQWRGLVKDKNNLELQATAYERRLSDLGQRIAKTDQKLAALDVKLLQIEGKTRSASGAQGLGKTEASAEALQVSLAEAGKALAASRIAFEQGPSRQGMDKLQATCSAAVTLMNTIPLLEAKARETNCDPSKAHEAAGTLYALLGGAPRLAASCSVGGASGVAGSGVAGSGAAGTAGKPAAGRLGEALNGSSVNEQIAFARRCLQISGLQQRDAAAITSSIDALERNRDDKAHRFVVTTNAFFDGNRLAYLALAIAAAIDALVFISGLFGANVLRSPLSAIPQSEGRSAKDLETMMANALLPGAYENASLALEAIEPVAIAASDQAAGLGAEWTHQVHLAQAPEYTRRPLRKILNAGSVIGAVKRDDYHQERYFLRGELIEFLNDAAFADFATSDRAAGASEMRRVLATALRPQVGRNAGIILGYLQPSSQHSGYSSKLVTGDVREEDRALVTACLNAAASIDLLLCSADEKDARTGDVAYVHKDLYKLLSLMADDGGLPDEAQEVENGPAIEADARRALELPALPPHEPPATTKGAQKRAGGSVVVSRKPASKGKLRQTGEQRPRSGHAGGYRGGFDRPYGGGDAATQWPKRRTARRQPDEIAPFLSTVAFHRVSERAPTVERLQTETSLIDDAPDRVSVPPSDDEPMVSDTPKALGTSIKRMSRKRVMRRLRAAAARNKGRDEEVADGAPDELAGAGASGATASEAFVSVEQGRQRDSALPGDSPADDIRHNAGGSRESRQPQPASKSGGEGTKDEGTKELGRTGQEAPMTGRAQKATGKARTVLRRKAKKGKKVPALQSVQEAAEAASATSDEPPAKHREDKISVSISEDTIRFD